MKKRLVITLTSVMLVACSCVSFAFAGTGNFGFAYETHNGILWNGYVQIQASYPDEGKHALQGYQRFKRKRGPALDTGRRYTEKSKSRWDTKVYSRKDQVWDSPIWGDDFTTKYFYGFEYWK